VFALAEPHPFFTNDPYAKPPPETLLKRMFDPVSKSNDPNVDGLGISPAELMRTAKHSVWGETPAGYDPCYFG
jgi:hypothetical protein